ncbi:MAG TPA: oligopeptide/dipeptide ABC transporter ATP-binding protein, partial [Stellaceae bacterium]|nr:oligopeptide/dipeptide ABC transporter ATP-binding protein [Stellaceae bacterium]
RVLVMYAGKPVEIGTVDDIYYRPRMPYTVGLLGSLPRLDKREQSRLTPIQGSPPSLVNLPPGCPFTPRCPISVDLCLEVEPALEPANGGAGSVRDHLAACHLRGEVAHLDQSRMFDRSSADAALPVDFGADYEEETEPGEERRPDIDYGPEDRTL